jgi:hypothetical protein
LLKINYLRQIADKCSNVFCSLLQLSSALSGNRSATLRASENGAVATFTDLAIGPAGMWSLVFSSAGLSSASSLPFIVSPGSPVALTLAAQPAEAFGGAAFGTQPIIAAIDKGGNVANASEIAYQVVPYLLSPSPNQTDLNGTSTYTKDGLFYFSNLTVDLVGSGYVIGFKLLTASGSKTSVTDAVSEPFDVKPGAPAAFRISTQPSAAVVAGYSFPVQPTIQVVDLGRNLANSSVGAEVFSKEFTIPF